MFAGKHRIYRRGGLLGDLFYRKSRYFSQFEDDALVFREFGEGALYLVKDEGTQVFRFRRRP
jgi:hypothetical protein